MHLRDFSFQICEQESCAFGTIAQVSIEKKPRKVLNMNRTRTETELNFQVKKELKTSSKQEKKSERAAVKTHVRER